MKLAQIRRHALSMPEVSEQPHFEAPKSLLRQAAPARRRAS
ncbi:MAG TPA: hypothetical protein VEN28_13755 [Burkholderiaceae bacterium]|nr:hypothetical protein [Burkholderiaceae bacterium]